MLLLSNGSPPPALPGDPYFGGDPAGIFVAPVIASDNTLGSFSPHQGRIYVAYVDAYTTANFIGNQPGDNTNIYLKYSDDGGLTWTTDGKIVNDDNGTTDGFSEANISGPAGSVVDNGRPQFSPSIAVDQATGTLALSFYDTRNDPQHARTALYVATSIDGGASFAPETFVNTPLAVTDGITGATVILGPIPDNQSKSVPATPGVRNGAIDNKGPGYGQSQGLAFLGGHLYPAWASNQNGGGSGTDALDIRIVSATVASGPRIVSSTMGTVGAQTVTDITGVPITFNDKRAGLNGVASIVGVSNGTALADGFVIEFDRPVNPATLNPSTPPAVPVVTVTFRDENTLGTSPGVNVLVSPVITPLLAGSTPQGPTRFLVRFAPQGGTGTYSYQVGATVADRVRTVGENGAITLGNLMDQNGNAVGGEDPRAKDSKGNFLNITGILPGDVYSAPRPAPDLADDLLRADLRRAVRPDDPAADRARPARPLDLRAGLGQDARQPRDRRQGVVAGGGLRPRHGPEHADRGLGAPPDRPEGGDRRAVHGRPAERRARPPLVRGRFPGAAAQRHLRRDPGLDGRLVDRRAAGHQPERRARQPARGPDRRHEGRDLLEELGGAHRRSTAGRVSTSTINVPDPFIVQNVTVTIDLSYPFDPDLDARLIAPDGTSVQLFSNVGQTGDSKNFTSTTFDDTATTPIQNGGPPFFGTFNPRFPLSQFIGHASQFSSGAGVWTLEVTDNAAGRTGTINSFTLNLTKPIPATGLGDPIADQATASFRIFNAKPDNTLASNTWTPVGPAGIGAKGAGLNAEISGRVTATAVDPSDPSGNTVFVSAAGGGIWKTRNFLTLDPAGPTYVPLTDTGPSFGLTVGSIAVFARNNDPNQSIIFATTGDADALGLQTNYPVASPATTRGDSDQLTTRGVGFLRSTDGGATWVLLDSTSNFDPTGVLLPLNSTDRDHKFVSTAGVQGGGGPEAVPDRRRDRLRGPVGRGRQRQRRGRRGHLPAGSGGRWTPGGPGPGSGRGRPPT